MRHFVRTSFGMLALGLIGPITASAQYGESSAPAGYQPASAVASGSLAPAGMDGKPTTAPTTGAPTQAPPLPHIHKWRTVCPACNAKQLKANPPGIPAGMKIVGCAHSKNGVCTACQAALNAPGTFVQPGAAPEAPGRALASSSSPAKAASSSPPLADYGPMGDPAPVGVVQAAYSQSNGMPMQAPMAGSAQPAGPGRAVAESSPRTTQSRDFYSNKSNGGFPHPHILGHLFGWSGIGSERREEKAFKKSETHAMETYDPNAPTGVNELPASAVFGKQK